MPDDKILEIKEKSKNKEIGNKEKTIIEQAHNDHKIFNQFFKEKGL